MSHENKYCLFINRYLKFHHKLKRNNQRPCMDFLNQEPLRQIYGKLSVYFNSIVYYFTQCIGWGSLWLPFRSSSWWHRWWLYKSWMERGFLPVAIETRNLCVRNNTCRSSELNYINLYSWLFVSAVGVITCIDMC